MDVSHNKIVSPLIILFFGVFAVSTSSIFIRMAQRDAPSLAVAAYRLTLASLILLPAMWGRRDEILSLDRRKWLLVALSGALLAVHFALWISSLAFTSVASSVVFVTTTPLWVGIIAPFLLKEQLDTRLWIGLLAATIGGGLVGLNDVCHLEQNGFQCTGLEGFYRGDAFWGNLLALGGAWMAAGYLMVGRILRPKLSLTGYIGTVYPAAAVFLLLFAFASGTQMSGFRGETFLWFTALAVIPQLLGHTSYNYALGYLPAAYVSVAVLGEPIGSSLLAVLVLGEAPTAVEVLGGVIILAGIGVASYKK
jgi:drug/metabolite transporter (DMT)-like permease